MAIIQLTKGKEVQVDHINGDTLDNRRENLRVVDRRTNKRNWHRIRGAVAYKGVYKHNRDRYRIDIQLPDGIKYRKGSFATAEAAAREYDRLSILHYGKEAKVNFPESKENHAA